MRSLEGLCSKGWRVLAQPARLLLEHIDSVFVLHLQLRGCVCFINWLSSLDLLFHSKSKDG